ncbi:MAG: tetratricopeptide repeat protein, partial [Candidatus Taylorbacteria bacterium]|nr:tetratricopeptide repeat protein [Candidatus Taylorbacteria bacterium]
AALALSFIPIAIFQGIRFFFGADVLTLGVFQSSTASLVGKWNDLGIFSGVIFILSYLALRGITIRKIYKIALIALLIISGLFIFIVNSSLIWGSISVVLVGMAAYEFFHKKIPVITIILLALSILFTINSAVITDRILGKLNIIQTEVTLPWQLTLDVAAGSIKESPLFGSGPNKFGTQYLKYKPFIVNPTIFWNTEFSNGSGWIPSFSVTGGIVSFLLWIALVVVFCSAGIKALQSSRDDLSKFFISSTFFSALFLWIMTLIYVPSHTILFLTFIWSGLFIATLVHEGVTPLTILGKNEKNILSSLIPLALIIIIAACLLWLCIYLKKVAALSYFQSGISALSLPNNEGLLRAEENFKKALNLDKNDTYYQALSEINIIKIIHLTDQTQAEKDRLVKEAIAYTQSAINLDPTNYYNYIAQARIYEIALSLAMDGAYESVIEAYTNALKYNPYNPALYLNKARIEASQNKLEEAKRDIGLALQLKQNYLDAIFLLSQIQISQGQIKEAITSVQVASQINPGNPLIFFQLGFLYYNDKNYLGAIEALNQAIKLDNKYANAQYFLGLSYARVGKVADAIIQFEALSITNPDNQEVALILSNLRAGKSPFTDAKPPVDSKPEQRKNLPVNER